MFRIIVVLYIWLKIAQFFRSPKLKVNIIKAKINSAKISLITLIRKTFFCEIYSFCDFVSRKFLPRKLFLVKISSLKEVEKWILLEELYDKVMH